MDSAGFPASGKRNAVGSIDFFAVNQNIDEIRARAVFNHDLEGRAVAPDRGREAGPAARDHWVEEQAIAAQPEPEDVFDGGSEHPSASTRIPGPAAAPRI